MRNHEKQIKKIMSEMKCPKDFACYKRDLRIFENAKDTPLESFVECADNEHAWQCEYSLLFGSSYLCKCPLRVYILKKIL